LFVSTVGRHHTFDIHTVT